LLVELPFQTEDIEDQTLFDVRRQVPWRSQIKLQLSAKGRARFEHRQGAQLSAVEVAFQPPEPGSHIRLTLCWHAPRRVGVLAVEDLGRGTCSYAVYEAPQPLSSADCADLARPGRSRLDRNLTALAVSDRVEPIRLGGGFTQGTQIDTPSGPRPVETLQTGDEVQTSAHGVQPIRGIVSYEAPSVGRLAPMRVAAPFFGLTRDLSLAQDHRLLVMGADSEYLFGQEEVLIEARHLSRIAGPLDKRRPPVQRYVHVLLDAHVCVSVGGGWAESLYLGDLRTQPLDHAMSMLADVPRQRLPRHTHVAGPLLRGYEAAVLVSALCA
jgi:hypothetical protein